MSTRTRRSRVTSIILAGCLAVAAPFVLSGCELLSLVDEISDEVDFDELSP